MTREILKSVLLLLVIAAGIILQAAGIIDLSGVNAWINSHADRWWAPAMLVLVMTVMYMFAFPGSILIPAAGVMYRPLWATAWVVLGGLLGAVSVYVLVRHFSAGRARRYSASAMFGMMRKQNTFLAFSALRIFPGVPHALINYSAGILRVNLLVFMASTAFGFAVKGFVYTSAIYHATHIETTNDAVSAATLWPLAAMSVLMIAGLFAHGLPRNKSAENR